MKAKVYFCKEITPENVVKMYEVLGKALPGKVAVKVHSGEKGNQNFLRPEFWRAMVEKVQGTIVECNTAYDGARNLTPRHIELMKYHGWSELFDVDIMDYEGPDLEIPIPDGVGIKRNLVGKNITNYDSMLVLSHFKGHPLGGFGGALKQLAIGCASSAGKTVIHTGDFTDDWRIMMQNRAPQDQFLAGMADAAGTVIDLFKGNLAYVSVMANISVDCDCNGGAKPPCMQDIGILSSLDPIALDQACLDLVYSSNDPGRDELVERIESRHGIHTVEVAAQHGYGTREYELIEL